MNFSYGADPEIFVFDKKTGNPVSAYEMIPGDKENPFPVKNGAVQVDGMALEFNILPVTNKKSFNTHVSSVMKQLRDMLPEGVEPRVCSSVHFNEDYLEAQPLKAKQLGCDPDYNAYTGMMNPPPEAHPSLRTAAGHIHIGWGKGNYDINSEEHLNACHRVVKAMDAVVGVWSVINDPDVERRKLYGKAGAFRPKPYGVEYRTLSNFWLSSKNKIDEVYSLTRNTIDAVMNNCRFQHWEDDVIYAINNSDVKEAIEIHDQVRWEVLE